MREVVVAYEVDTTELSLVHAQFVGGGLHHSLLEEHCLGDAERAAIRDASRCFVRVDTPSREMRRRDVVTRECGVHQPDLELRGLRVGEKRSVVGVRVHPHPEDLSVVA